MDMKVCIKEHVKQCSNSSKEKSKIRKNETQSISIDLVRNIFISLLSRGLDQESIVSHLKEVYGYSLSYGYLDLFKHDVTNISNDIKKNSKY